MSHQQKIGIVVSNKMDKSLVVQVETRLKHTIYGKTMSKTKRYIVHDPDNVGQIGNLVILEQYRPVSANKCWTLKNILT